jgi:hypothetical protein
MIQFTHVIGKPLPISGGDVLPSGRLVDASGWRNTLRLADQRYLQEVPPGIEPFVDADGNAWVDRESAERAGVVELLEAEAVETVKAQSKTRPEFPQHVGFGRWRLSDGTVKQRAEVPNGRPDAEAAEAALTG